MRIISVKRGHCNYASRAPEKKTYPSYANVSLMASTARLPPHPLLVSWSRASVPAERCTYVFQCTDHTSTNYDALRYNKFLHRIPLSTVQMFSSAVARKSLISLTQRSKDLRLHETTGKTYCNFCVARKFGQARGITQECNIHRLQSVVVFTTGTIPPP